MRRPRTTLSVNRKIETITGERSAWHFRPHYHAGDEIVRITAGRARLRLPHAFRVVQACPSDTLESAGEMAAGNMKSFRQPLRIAAQSLAARQHLDRAGD